MCRRLQKFAGRGYVIWNVDVSAMPENRRMSDDDVRSLIGLSIDKISRNGKMIEFDLSDGRVLVSHNAMSGYWDDSSEPWTFDYVEGKRTSRDSDVRATITLCVPDNVGDKKFLVTKPEMIRLGHTLQMRFHDTRKFGSLHILDSALLEERLGPEALETGCSSRRSSHHDVLSSLRKKLEKSKKTIKEVLMDQTVIAGVGNIYAVEALWHASVAPDRPAKDIEPLESDYIVTCVCAVMNEAIVKDLRYEEYLKVYRRKSCVRCGSDITKFEIAKRSTYACRTCQR